MVNWYKADTGAVTTGPAPATNGDPVIVWNDQGIQNVRQESFGNPPIYNTTGFNSRPSLDFTPSGSTICGNRAAVEPTLNSPTCSLFIAMKINGSSINGPIATFFSTGATCYNGTNTFFLRHADADGITLYGNSTYLVVTGSPPTSGCHTIGMVYDGANVTLYIDGVSVGSHAWTTNIGSSIHSDNGLYLGGDQFGNFAYISIAEVIFTNTAENAASVHAYMAARLGY